MDRLDAEWIAFSWADAPEDDRRECARSNLESLRRLTRALEHDIRRLERDLRTGAMKPPGPLTTSGLTMGAAAYRITETLRTWSATYPAFDSQWLPLAERSMAVLRTYMTLCGTAAS